MIKRITRSDETVAKARLVALLLLLAIPILTAAPVPRESKHTRTDFFPTQVGSKWVYKNSQNEEWERTDVITDVEVKDGATLIQVGTLTKRGKLERSEKMQLSQQGLFKIDATDQGTDLATRYLKFPIHSGDKWDCFVRGTIGEATCEGFEEVEVPAGRFRAAKVVVRYETRDLGGGEVTAWFATGIGPVKYEFGSGGAAEVLYSFTAGTAK